MGVNLYEIICTILERNGLKTEDFISQLGITKNEYLLMIEKKHIESQTLLFLSQYFRKDLIHSYSQLYFEQKNINTFYYNKNELTKNELSKKYYSNVLTIEEICNILCISPKILDFYINLNDTDISIEKKFHLGNVIKLFCLNSGLSINDLSEIMKKSIKEILLDFNKKSLRHEEILKWSFTLNINLFEILSLHYESLCMTNHRYKIKIKEIC